MVSTCLDHSWLNDPFIIPIHRHFRGWLHRREKKRVRGVYKQVRLLAVRILKYAIFTVDQMVVSEEVPNRSLDNVLALIVWVHLSYTGMHLLNGPISLHDQTIFQKGWCYFTTLNVNTELQQWYSLPTLLPPHPPSPPPSSLLKDRWPPSSTEREVFTHVFTRPSSRQILRSWESSE